jgi:hypothetical protein
MVAYTSLGFGIVGLIACLCCKDVNSKMNNTIEAFIAGEEEKAHTKVHHGHADEKLNVKDANMNA